MPAADLCTQDIREVSIPGGVPPAINNIYDQCEDVKMREEAEGATEAGREPAVNVHKVTLIEDSVGSREEWLPPDPCYNAEDEGVYARQSVLYNHEEERKGLHYLQDADAENQRDEGDIKTEDVGGSTEAGDPAQRRETVSRESQLGGSFKDQDRQRRPQEGLEGDDNASFNDHKYKQEVSNMHVRQECPQHVCVEMQTDQEMMVMDVSRVKDGKMEGDDQSESRGRALPKYLDRHAEHRDNDGLDVRQNINEDLGGTQKTGQHYGEQGDEERMEIDVEVEKEGKTGADERRMAPESGKLLKKYDLCYYIPSCERGQEREEKRGAQGVNERWRGDDKHAQMRETSERHQHFSQDVDGQNRSEQRITTTHTRQQQENKRDERIQNRADSSLRRAGSAGSRRPTDDWGVGSVEKTQPKAGFVPDAQVEAAGIKHAIKKRGAREKKRRWWHHSSPLKQLGKEKHKKKKTTGCFSLFRKSRKTADLTSESD